ncbi:ABC transporter permease [Heyndrickxia sporothermodurans]|uniref:ABC transporter permease n=1 Tax=Heyndrickxia sporothermodurans TaxID=46224 RepID=UPI002E1D289C|nr:ABC transporter permease [Heyndrickxia sporothermodurans]MED3697036.1 ABC transporter permease [Heyndrickxia sporothermodurans]
MKQIESLWKERVQLYIHELRKYLKYIFNDHLLFVAIFALGAGAYYYNGWVKTLDESFPIGLVMGILLGLFLTMSPIYTLLKEADKVYLLPIEMKMASYFRKSILFSFVIQAYLLLMLLAICMPMYVQASGNGFQSFLYILIVLFILKVWNLYLQWDMLKIQDQRTAIFDWLIRFVLNSCFIYFIIERANPWIYGLFIILYLALFVFYHRTVKGKTLKWDVLIDKEQKRLNAFYRFANLFTDVPKLKGQVKRRKWLDWIFQFISYEQKNTYTFLFARTLIRSSEFFGLYMRLSIIGAILLYFSNQMYLSIGISILFLFLTAFQLIPMVNYHELKIWQYLYPVDRTFKEKSFLTILTVSIFIQSIFFGVVVLFSQSWLNGLIVCLAGILFSVIFTKSYVPVRLRKMSRSL